MKISAKSKAKNRKAILDATVDLVIEQGFRAATMRAIARKAGVGDATIYNYFPTKDAIFYAYYEDRFAAAAEGLEASQGLGWYSLQERLQALFEELLGVFLPDREFIQATFRPVFFSLPPNIREMKPIQAHFFAAVSRSFAAAREKGELEELVLEDLVVRLFWDYFLGVAAYWLRDESEQFSATSILIDKTMGLGCAVLKAGVVGKAIDIFAFLFRHHVVSLLDGPRFGLDVLKDIGAVFMERVNGRQDAER